MYIPTVVVITTILAGSIQGYKDCLKPKSTPQPEEWMIKHGKEGLYFVEHSDCDNCEKDNAWTWLKGRSTVKKMCWEMDLVTKGGDPHTLLMLCEYFEGRVEDQNCKLDFSNTPLSGMSMAGKITITLTDRDTYFAGTVCLFGKENWWFLAARTETLSQEIKTKVSGHVKKLGFKAQKAVEGKSPIFLKKMRIKAC